MIALTVPSHVSAQRSMRSNRPATRIAVFDSRVIFDSLPERNAVESEFALEQAKARTLVAEASDSLRKALDALVRADSTLSAREREAGRLHLRAQELLVEQMMENLDALIQQRLDELRQPMLQRVRDAVRAVRVREGYQLALDHGNNGIVFDADLAIDITAAVLQELRKQARDGSASNSREPVQKTVSAPKRGAMD